MSIKKIQYLKKPSPKDVVDVISDFMGAWCLHCDIGQTINPNIDIETLVIPCPKEVWDTCPILNRIKSYQQKKEDYHAAILPGNKDSDSSSSRLPD